MLKTTPTTYVYLHIGLFLDYLHCGYSYFEWNYSPTCIGPSMHPFSMDVFVLNSRSPDGPEAHSSCVGDESWLHPGQIISWLWKKNPNRHSEHTSWSRLGIPTVLFNSYSIHRSLPTETWQENGADSTTDSPKQFSDLIFGRPYLIPKVKNTWICNINYS